MKEVKNKKNRGLKIFGKIILGLLIVLVLIIGVTFAYVNYKLGKIQKVELNTADLGISQEVSTNLSGYRNIALFGIDSRQADDYATGNRSDCIIIATINEATKEVKLTSVYRDTYVEIEGHGLDKITHAYSYGEAQLAVNTLNSNLDLNISEFVTVNFDAVEEIVNALGGIDINIIQEEIQHLKSTGITTTGVHHLNGEQALAYSRIRYATGGDYKRTERMRTVIDACLTELKTKSVTQINTLADEILPKIYTNINTGEILSLASNATSYKITNSIGWPYETQGITLDRWYGVPITLESNVTKLHKELFGEQNYNPSDAVKQVSQKIINKTDYDK